ncbi:MAG: hypothetical protein U5K77_04210 [Candidatus Saccharibacteria bacterium]|nr:hypothetical protein [Candidatus Saccharibacteria bacterium]
MARQKESLNKLFVSLGIARISVGLVFLWAFLDKLIGLGFSTCRDAATNGINVMCDSAALQGGSSTTGFLKFGTQGPFADFYAGLAGNGFIDLLFMTGLLGIGVALTFGIATKLGTISGAVMLMMMWTAVLPPEHHPVLDDHVVYSVLLAAIYFGDNNQRLGFGKQWKKTALVKKFPILS